MLRGGRLLIHKPGTLRGKDLLVGWIQHLALCLTRSNAETLLFDLAGSWRFAPLAHGEAYSLLTALVSDWQEGLTRPLPFFPNTALAWLNAQGEGDEQKAAQKAQDAFNGGYHTVGEVSDPYVARCFPELDEATLMAMIPLALRHFSPLMAAREELA